MRFIDVTEIYLKEINCQIYWTNKLMDNVDSKYRNVLEYIATLRKWNERWKVKMSNTFIRISKSMIDISKIFNWFHFKVIEMMPISSSMIFIPFFYLIKHVYIKGSSLYEDIDIPRCYPSMSMVSFDLEDWWSKTEITKMIWQMMVNIANWPNIDH